eukprot:4740646-Pyramimonas_sp.AAC.1
MRAGEPKAEAKEREEAEVANRARAEATIGARFNAPFLFTAQSALKVSKFVARHLSAERESFA